MPWADLLPYIGISGSLLMILLPFWKADDMISDHARRDLSDYLLRIGDQVQWKARSAADDFLDSIYGPKLLSVRSVLIVGVISLTLALILMISLFDLIDFVYYKIYPRSTGFRTGAILFDLDSWDPLIAGMAKVQLMASINFMTTIVFINVIVDFVMTLCLRKLIKNNNISLYLSMFIFFIISFFVILLYLIICSIVFYAVGGLNSLLLYADHGVYNWYDLSGVSVLISEGYRQVVEERSSPEFGMIISTIITTFACAAWLLAIKLGSMLIRAINSTQVIFYLQWALPIESRPIRSIGIFVTLFCVVVFGAYSLALVGIQLFQGPGEE